MNSPSLPLIVIGAGPAGIAAAVEARRTGSSVILVDRAGRIGGTVSIAHELRNLPFARDHLNGAEVAHLLADYAHRWQLDVVRADVRAVHRDGNQVRIVGPKGHLFDGCAAVIATGTQALLPAIDGLPTTFAAPWYASAVAAWLDACPASVAVIGGSDVAFDQARWLRARGVAVTVLCRGARSRAPSWLVQAASAEGVQLRTRIAVQSGAVLKQGVRLELRTAAGTEYATFDVLVAAIGRNPTLPEIVPAMQIDDDRVRVAGDATGRRSRHVIAAMGDGCVAAADMLALRQKECENESG